VRITLVAAEKECVERPMTVAEPFELGTARGIALRRIVADFRRRLRPGRGGRGGRGRGADDASSTERRVIRFRPAASAKACRPGGIAARPANADAVVARRR
jgi:hypothetical protein